MNRVLGIAVIAVVVAGILFIACKTSNKAEAQLLQQSADTAGKMLVCGRDVKNLEVYYEDTDSGEVHFTDKVTLETWTGSFKKLGNDAYIMHCDKKQLCIRVSRKAPFP